MKRAILLLALISAPAGAQTWSDSGLETDNYKQAMGGSVVSCPVPFSTR